MNRCEPIARAVAVIVTAACLAVVVSALAPAAHAQSREGRDERGDRGRYPEHRERYGTAHWELDGRFHHDRYYPVRGYYVPGLPPGHLDIVFGPDRFYFHSGVWFRRAGPRFIVVAPPLGIVIPVLPPGFVTLRFGSVPYYYANDVYYTAGPGGYVVVAPPPGVQPVEVPPPPPIAPSPPSNPDLIVYPRNGQSEAQTETDRGECSQWATGQARGQDAKVYLRAVTACLEGRGYTVR